MEKKKPTIDEIYKINVDGLFESTANWFDTAFKKSQAEINRDLYNKINGYSSSSESTGGNVNLGPLLTSLNGSNLYPSRGYLYYNGNDWEFNTPTISGGGEGGVVDTAAITKIVNDTIKNVSWWGQKINNNKVDGNIVITKGSHSFTIELDDNGNLKFNGNIYATGGITALGVGTTTGGGSSASLGTLLAQLNNENPFPTDNGQVLTYDGSNFVWKIPTGSGGSGSIQVAQTPEYSGGSENWVSATKLRFVGITGTKPTIRPNSDKGCVDVGIPTGSGSGSSSRINYITLFNSRGESFETIDLGTADTIGFMQGDNVTLQAVTKEFTNVIKISATGGNGGSGGSSGTTAGRLRFYKDSSEESWNGESDFKIIFGSGLNVTWDSHSQITLSATGGSGGSSTGGSVDLSSYLTKTEASTTYAAKSHTHLAADITNFASTVKGITVDNAKNAESANKLASPIYLWGNSFNGVRNIGSADSNKADLRYVNNIYTGDTFGLYNTVNGVDTSLLSIDNTPNISVAYGYRSNENAILSLFGNKTKIYTNGQDYHFDFVRNVFDVNSNQIHFGSETNGGKISWDAANNAFKIEGNVYATGGITALGVSNNATTSNNVDFTFNSVTSKRNIIYAVDNVPFKIYPKNNINTPLIFSHNGVNWNIYDDDTNDIHLQRSCTIDSDGWVFSPQFHSKENGYMSLDGSSFYLGDTNNNVNVVFTYNGSKYRLDMSRAISVGVFTMLSTQELSTLQARMIKKKAVS